MSGKAAEGGTTGVARSYAIAAGGRKKIEMEDRPVFKKITARISAVPPKQKEVRLF